MAFAHDHGMFISRLFAFQDWTAYECQEIAFICEYNLNFSLNDIIIQYCIFIKNLDFFSIKDDIKQKISHSKK